MTDQAPENQAQIQEKTSDKEFNFRRQEEMYQRQLEQERLEKQKIQRELEELRQRQEAEQVEEEPEPYVDHKRLEKKLNNFGQQQKKQTQAEIQKAIQDAIEIEKQSAWLENHEDFNETMKHAEKFAKKHPKLADSILKMPECFERQKLVYSNIKAMGLDQTEQKQPSIQEKIESNRQMPFYQPTTVGSAPYSSQSDFSPKGRKEAYDKMMELKSRLKLG